MLRACLLAVLSTVLCLVMVCFALAPSIAGFCRCTAPNIRRENTCHIYSIGPGVCFIAPPLHKTGEAPCTSVLGRSLVIPCSLVRATSRRSIFFNFWSIFRAFFEFLTALHCCAWASKLRNSNRRLCSRCSKYVHADAHIPNPMLISKGQES